MRNVITLRIRVALLRAGVWLSPRRYSQPLVNAAFNLGRALERVGRFQDATAAYRMAVAVSRSLRNLDPGSSEGLAGSLSTLSYCLCRQGRHDEEIAARAEEIALWQDMAADRPELVKSLHDQAIAFHMAGRHAEAVAAWAEAIEVRIPLAAIDHEHRAYLASARRWRADSLAALGRYGEALADLNASVDGYREAAVVEPDEYLPQVAQTLRMRAETLARSGLADDPMSGG
ncbi:Tetratricopeptide repeat-containing protein [Micromonospora coriariae]|uniref:Tetratricopeptide repeat-containing protein n=2 Tax=Micromonospora coriariae TaxID=285665 RepID=A0A1C4U321_9ACTN|nr:Tetratricopeptide repeat-containing protein [Micromonospora coriariae]